MGSISNRLARLEDRVGMSATGDERAAARKVLSRMSVEELRVYVSALRRMKAGESLVEEDGPILQRVKELHEEVRNGN